MEVVVTWTYSQSTGKLAHNGNVVGEGYSGHGAGKDNPNLQFEPNIGPIPQGIYHIGAPHNTDSHGPFVMRLTPAPGNAMGHRAGFLIHGDNKRHDASQGCVILAPHLRHRVWGSGDRTLTVTR
jgi:hypothetical protein